MKFLTKKVEIWIVLILFLVGFIFLVIFGTLVRQELVGTQKFGKISKTALLIAEFPVLIKEKLQIINQINNLKIFEGITGFNGSTLNEKKFLLQARFDGDTEQSIVELIDLRDFKVKYFWSLSESFAKLIKRYSYCGQDETKCQSKLNFIHPFLMDDGGLVFNILGSLVKIDHNSKLIWQNNQSIFHHSTERDIDGNFWAPTRIYEENLNRNIPQTIDAISKISPNGQILFQKTIKSIFNENFLEDYLTTNNLLTPTQLNDIQPVMNNGEFWELGDIFISLKGISKVVLYRPITNKIIWISDYHLYHQHDIDIINDHQISIFNNNIKDLFSLDGGHNEVIIYDFETKKYSKYMNDALINNDVRTQTEGLAQILDNGDLFIEEQNFGRTLYFNKDSNLKWQHVNKDFNDQIHEVNWSRIFYSQEDINKVSKFLNVHSIE